MKKRAWQLATLCSSILVSTVFMASCELGTEELNIVPDPAPLPTSDLSILLSIQESAGVPRTKEPVTSGVFLKESEAITLAGLSPTSGGTGGGD